jgi:hypothetical protein
MGNRKALLLAGVVFFALVFGPSARASDITQATVIACSGTPGNTVGAYRVLCQTSAGALYACNNSSGCTVAADWVAQGGGSGPTIDGTTNQISATGAGCTGAGTCTLALTFAPHVMTFVIDGGGSALTTGALKDFPTANFACTINLAQISADQSGSITVDIWKAAGAIPTSANKISASSPVTLSSSQLNQNSSLSGWTTTVSVGDVFGFNIATASTVTHVVGQIWCQ